MRAPPGTALERKLSARALLFSRRGRERHACHRGRTLPYPCACSGGSSNRCRTDDETDRAVGGTSPAFSVPAESKLRVPLLLRQSVFRVSRRQSAVFNPHGIQA